MTYIVGGKLNNAPFLMIDCKVQNTEKEFKFQDKVVSFNSYNTVAFYCQMGHAIIKHFITMYDYMLTFGNKKINVCDINDIKEMFCVINEAIHKSNFDINTIDDNHLFFITKDDICKYKVSFNNDEKKYFNITKIQINNNECVTSNSVLKRNVNVESGELKDFCKSVIEQEKMGIEDDLKDRFTFIKSNGNELIYDFPYKSTNDIINMFTEMGFDKLGD